MDEVYMDTDAVRNMAKNFQTISTTLQTVAKTLEGLSNVLKGTAFVGAVGGMVYARFMDMIRPYIEQMSAKCAELSSDLSASVDAFERGDAQGATRFY